MDKLAVVEHNVPAYWVSLLINGDSSGLTTEEVAKVLAFCKANGLPASAASCETYGIGRFDGLQCELEKVTWLVPYLPFVIRRKYFADAKKWELFAVFPTIAADSSSWHNMQGYAENGDSFSVSQEYMNASRKIRGHDPARVAAFESDVRRVWELDDSFPCRLFRYERLQGRHHDERQREWRKGRG